MYGNKFKEATQSLMSYCREHMGYDTDPDVRYATDSGNANNMLGYTAHYQPDKKVVTVYISNRHPKDVLRSLSHELVHHAQNCRGDLENTQTEEGYAQKDPHMRKMEEEAYLKGNMMFRDWEDSCKQQNMILPSTIGENKMSEQLNNLIAEKVKTKLEEQGVQVDEGFFDKLRARAAGFTAGTGQAGKNLATGYRAAKAAIAGDKEAAKAELDKTASVKDVAQARVLSSRARGAYKQIGKLYNELVKDFQALGFIDEKGSSVGPSEKSITKLMAGLKDAQAGLAMVADEKKISKLSALAAKGRTDLKQSLKPQEPEQQTEETEELEEGACPECGMSPCACPMHEEVEDIEEEKMPDKNKDGIPDYAQDGKGSKDLGKEKGADSDDKEEKEDDDKEEKSDKDMSKVPPQLRKHVAKKKVDENELTDIKKKQSSINGLNENRLMNVNKELMRRLLK